MKYRETYLIKVEPNENNNKYYRMIPKGNGFEAQYGRVGGSYQTARYPFGRWYEKLNEKLRKGYLDMTHLLMEPADMEKKADFAEISDPAVSTIVSKLMSMARQAISENYTVSSSNVTQMMVKEAQSIISDIISQTSRCTVGVEQFNAMLLDLFRTIPRKMSNVSGHLAKSEDDFGRIIKREQDLLDVMEGQVAQRHISGDEASVESDKTILEAMGIDISGTDDQDIALIKESLGDDSWRFCKAWRVKNFSTQEKFDKFVSEAKITEKDRKLLWHGSRNENWWSILCTGLVLKPSAAITGKMFGQGIYFAPKAGKSVGYTSVSGAYWTKGTSDFGYLGLYDVAYGKPFNVRSLNDGVGSNFTYNDLQRICPGAHCVHAHAGNMLRNDEIIVYKEDQVTVKYLVEIR